MVSLVPQTFCVWPVASLGFGHLCWVNWGLIIKCIGVLLHQSDCSGSKLHLHFITGSHVTYFGAGTLMLLVSGRHKNLAWGPD